MKNLKRTVSGFIMLFILMTSCEKESEQSPDNLPENATEAFELITHKWDFQSNADFNSIELTKDYIYIIDKINSNKSSSTIFKDDTKEVPTIPTVPEIVCVSGSILRSIS